MKTVYTAARALYSYPMTTTQISDATWKKLIGYTGTFGFMLDMQYRALNNKTFSEKQVAAIEKCLAPKAASLPNAKPAATVEFTAPSGSYAIEFGGDPIFMNVKRVEDATSKWNGWVFIKRQASDELYPMAQIKPNGEVKTFDQNAEKYMGLLNMDPKTACARYGHMIGKCGCCGKTLTDPVSIENGVGPICIANNGW